MEDSNLSTSVPSPYQDIDMEIPKLFDTFTPPSFSPPRSNGTLFHYFSKEWCVLCLKTMSFICVCLLSIGFCGCVLFIIQRLWIRIQKILTVSLVACITLWPSHRIQELYHNSIVFFSHTCFIQSFCQSDHLTKLFSSFMQQLRL